jgi:hypothetical protein
MHLSQKLLKQHLLVTTASAITFLQILQWRSAGTPSSSSTGATGAGESTDVAFPKSNLASPLVGQCWMKWPGTRHLRQT